MVQARLRARLCYGVNYETSSRIGVEGWEMGTAINRGLLTRIAYPGK